MKAVINLELPATEGGWSQNCYGDGLLAAVAVNEVRRATVEVRWVAVVDLVVAEAMNSLSVMSVSTVVAAVARCS